MLSPPTRIEGVGGGVRAGAGIRGCEPFGTFPAVAFSPSFTRERDSANRPINGISNGQPDTYNTLTVPLDASYELDLWGRVRRMVESARPHGRGGERR